MLWGTDVAKRDDQSQDEQRHLGELTELDTSEPRPVQQDIDVVQRQQPDPGEAHH
jgi:hypothetical protein